LKHPFRRAVEAQKIYANPSPEQMREWALPGEITTVFGSANYVTKVRNRSAKMTYIVADGTKLGVMQQPMELSKAEELRNKVHEYLKGKELIALDRDMCQNPEMRLHCRLYISKHVARIPLQWYNTLFEASNPESEPDIISIYVPEWPERIIFAHPEAGVTYILGTDYFGECKKSFLRMAMYIIKKRGGLGLHAGSKVLKIKRNGKLQEVGFIMFGLSGTGKTTLTLHDHGLQGEEGVIIRQDDVVLMNEKGFCYGTERGFFIKTEGLEPSQEVLYSAATKPTALYENVWIQPDGKIDFMNSVITGNGRGVILRSDVANTDDTIDLQKANKILFITRRDTIVPIVAKLTHEQAAAYFMLGESIETSAGDPTKAGQSKREVGTNPFIIGPESEEGNRLLDILKSNTDMECYLINTGSVGKNGDKAGTKITIKVTTSVMKHIALDDIEWVQDPDWGYLVPSKIEGIDMEAYDPKRYYTKEEYHKLTEELRAERKQWLAKFPGLRPEIVKAVEK
jgi:phosphoenolpyruvate carboxykinase (ATP)